MSIADLFQFLMYVTLLIAAIKPLGWYITRVFSGEEFWLRPKIAKIENTFYKIAGIRPDVEQHWIAYVACLLIFHAVGFVVLYAILRLQAYLPFNPNHVANLSPDLALNTAISFLTNTNWQNYSGEVSLSHLSQMVGLTVQNFFSAANGMVVAIALIRGFSRQEKQTIGNFWVDVTRAILYVLLPLSIILAIFLIWQGVPQNFSGDIAITTLEYKNQMIPQGPVAAQEAIKIIGTNGGGFFNTNSSHPYENPTPLSNFLQMMMMAIIGAALTNVFGRMIGDQRQGWAIFTAMACLLFIHAGLMYYFEQQPNPILQQMAAENNLTLTGINMEGKEVRFGLFSSIFYANLTTATATGAVNAMHSSFMPLSGGIMLWNMMLGGVLIGGTGSGLYGMLLFVILTAFIAGLMVGRTPEYKGNKLQIREIKMTVLATLVIPFLILGFTALTLYRPDITQNMANPGAHGFSELLYFYTSTATGNGSAFAGFNANTPFFNIIGAVVMLFGRLLVMIPVLAIAGSLAAKRLSPITVGSLPTHNFTFIILLIGVIFVFSLLLPALALGPIAEHFLLISAPSP